MGLLVREEYYADTDEDKKAAEGKATLIIAKQRNGPVGDVKLTFTERVHALRDEGGGSARGPVTRRFSSGEGGPSFDTRRAHIGSFLNGLL